MRYATQKTVKELELLFEFCHPQILRERLTFIFFQYLATSSDTVSSENRKEMIEDFYFLIHFLQEAEKNQKI